MKEIQLTQGKVAIVDDEDYEWLSNWWSWFVSREGKVYYAVGKQYSSDKKTTRMHRLIINAQKGQRVDHINNDGLDNRRENLRLCTHAQNLQNRGKTISNTSGYKGVVWNKRNKKWMVRITVNYTENYLGYFDDIIQAAKAYDQAAKKYHGEFAHLNFPP